MNINNQNLDNIIQDYVHGRLNDADANEFEEYFLSNPSVIEQIETTQHLSNGLRELENTHLQTSKLSSNNQYKNNKSSTISIYEKLLALISIPVPAFAVVALAAILSPIALQSLNQQDPNSQLALVNFSTQTTRSNNQSIAINLPDNKTNSAVLIKLKTVDFEHYTLKIIPFDETEPVWISKPFQASILRDKLVILPKLSSLDKVKLEVYGIDSQSNETKVDFCHYSEICK